MAAEGRSVMTACRVLAVSESGYCARKNEPEWACTPL